MDRLRQNARALRHDPTKAERLLWSQLRYWQIEGAKFRRQQPIGRYIVDFVCFDRKIIIELDGGQHAEQTNYDSERDSWLRLQGFSVLRFWNNEVLLNLSGVKEAIQNKLKSTPFLNPSPQGGRSRSKKQRQPNY